MFLSLFLAASITANVDKVQRHFEEVESKHLLPMLTQVVQFQTYAGNDEAHREQKAWLMKAAADLGFVARDAGKVTEIELPGPQGAPVLGLVVHGDVQPVDVEAWSFPPFSGHVADGFIHGRGTADDKGPLVQALLAMKALKESGIARTHTIRLIVGSTEESDSAEMGEYLKDHQAPDYSLVLDSEFPVVVGEKAWDGFVVTATLGDRGESDKPYTVGSINAGLAPSIVPDRAELRLLWTRPPVNWDPIIEKLKAAQLPEGTRIAMDLDRDNAEALRVVAYGRSAHAGVNLPGGRNALVALAKAMEGMLPAGAADDLFTFIRLAGQDLHATGLGIKDHDPVWGRYAVNVATVKPADEESKRFTLYINLRRIPPRTGAQLKAHLYKFVEDFNRRTGASLVAGSKDEYWDDTPLGFDPKSKLVKRLLRNYERATGTRAKPAISGGGTYAKRLPNAIAFGMWFPGKPYPGHDVDEKMPVDDLFRGSRVLIYTLVDIATGPRIVEPFKR